MNGIVNEFQFTVVARTRDEAIGLMDEVSMTMLNELGGAPWVAIDDDIKRVPAQGVTIGDDQGFMYMGVRSYKFGGPFFGHEGMPLHDNFNVQNSIRDER